MLPVRAVPLFVCFVSLLPTWSISTARAEPGAEFATTKEGIVGTYRKAFPKKTSNRQGARRERQAARDAAPAALLDERYDLGDRPSQVKMSGGRKPVQEGVRVKLPHGMTWDRLAQMSPDEIRAADAFPGRLPAAAACQARDRRAGVPDSSDRRDRQAGDARSLQRFDVDFDLPDHLLPEFPPPIFLTTRPELGDVSHGQVLTIKNYYRLFKDILTPVQIEGLRLLLTPFPQEEFNQTDDRKVAEPSSASPASTATPTATPTAPST